MFNIWKISAPKDRIISIIDTIDADGDGYVSFGEVRDLLERYAKDVKRSMRFGRLKRR